MPHLGKLVRLFDFLVSLEMSDQPGSEFPEDAAEFGPGVKEAGASGGLPSFLGKRVDLNPRSFPFGINHPWVSVCGVKKELC